MQLTEAEKRMMAGEEGPAVQLAMQILTRLGDVYGADRLVLVSSVHAACAYPNFISAVEMMEKFAGLGGKFKVLTTADPVYSPDNFGRWPEFPEPERLKQAAARQVKAIQKMGVIPNWSCTPYLQGNLPRLGECVAWVESSAIIFANSVLGARTNRNTMGIDIAAAITGRIPEYGLLLDNGRAANAVVRMEFQPKTMFDYNNVGFLIGKACSGKVPVIEGLPPWTTANHLKVMGAAAATRGGLALYHAVGMTPEAVSREHTLKGRKPELDISIKAADIQAAISEMNTVQGSKIDAVLVGCPHPSVGEVAELAGLLLGRKVRQDLKFCLFLSSDVMSLSRQMGYIDAIEESGARTFVGDCILSHPVAAWGWKSIATNSAKYACTLPSHPTNLAVRYMDTRGCVELATGGG